MIRFGAFVTLLFALLAPLAAQQRHAAVLLEDGREFEGRVLSMDLEHLVIQVGKKRLKIPASFVRSCRFSTVESAGQEEAPPAAEGADRAAADAGRQAPPAGPVAAAPAGEVAPPAREAAKPAVPAAEPPRAEQAADPAAEQPVDVGATGEPAEPAEKAAPQAHITWSGPLEDPVGGDAHNTELVHSGVRSLWQRRMAQLEARYPWLAPTRPAQWVSIGLLLLIGAGLLVHLSVVIAGADAPELGRSVMLGIWYLATGLGQVAIVSVNDLSVVLMLLANTTMALFGLCSLFGLSRFGAVVAMVVQLGFGVLVFGVFELVTALLGTVGAAG